MAREDAGRRCCPGAGREAAPLPRPWGSRFGDVTSGRIVRGGLARIELGRIPSRWARTARGGVDCVALGSHCASRTRPAPAPGPGISLSGAGITQAGPAPPRPGPPSPPDRKNTTPRDLTRQPRPGPVPVGRIRAGPKVDGVLVVAAGGRDDVNRARVIGAGVSSLRLCGSSPATARHHLGPSLISAPVRVLADFAGGPRDADPHRRTRAGPRGRCGPPAGGRGSSPRPRGSLLRRRCVCGRRFCGRERHHEAELPRRRFCGRVSAGRVRPGSGRRPVREIAG